MSNLLLSSLILSFSVSLLSLLYFRKLAFNFNLLDIPGGRKSHLHSTPLIGGLSIYLGLVTGLVLLKQDLEFVIASFFLVLIGVLDDYLNVPHRIRIMLQLCVIIVLLETSNIFVTSLGDIINIGDIKLNQTYYFFTIIAILGAINAMNFIDGLDGLAASLALITFSSSLILLYLSGAYYMFVLCFCTILIPFLFLNTLSKNKVFLGDSGSTLLGFGIAWALMNLSQGVEAILKPVTALWIFSIPLFDTVAVIIRRAINMKSPFNPDRTHIHHILLDKFRFSEIQTLLIISLLAIVMSMLGIVMELINTSEWMMYSLFLFIFLLYSFWTYYYSNRNT